jgi:ATP-dependent RNA helicase RhlE
LLWTNRPVATPTVAEGISQIVYPVVQSQKAGLLLALLKSTEMRSVLVFTRTKHGADRVAQRLGEDGHRAGRLHSNRSQNQRQAAMEDFRHGRTKLLVATDIAARGIDVKNISHVVNFDVPRHPEDYVHRIGRTGRAGHEGMALSFACPDQKKDLEAIERLTRQALTIHFRVPFAVRSGGGAPRRSAWGAGRRGGGGGFRRR